MLKTMNRVHTEAFLLCLIATLASLIALAREDMFFTALFATAIGLAFVLALRQGGDK
jgi:hypothetical protein